MNIIALISYLLNQYGGTLLFIAFIIWWFRRGKVRKKRLAKQAEELAQRPGIDAKAKSDAEMRRLGATPEQRFKAIEELFNRKSDTISIELKEYHNNGNVVLEGTLARPLAAMPPREREALRIAYHLYNIGELESWNFHLARLALLYGDGKAAVYNQKFTDIFQQGAGSINRDPAAIFKSYTGINAENAVSTMLHILEQAAVNKPDNPAIRLLASRFQVGGQAQLSQISDFQQAQAAANGPPRILGAHEDTGSVVSYTGEGSIITIAPPGSGKTQCHVFPTLLSWKGPAVVLDVKGEIHAGTSQWRRDNVGPVYKFAPLDPDNSNSYNPLSVVRSNPEFLWSDSRLLADMMIVPTDAKDPFWETRARDVLAAAIARACLTEDPAKRSLGAVLDVFHSVGWDAFIRDLQACVDIRSIARAGHSLGEMDRKTRDGVLQTGLSSLSAWDGDRIERATRKSDWSPLELRSGKNPTIYICLKQNEVQSYISVLRVFIAQHIQALIAERMDHPPPVLFVLDELPQLRYMQPIEAAIDVGRDAGIRLWMFAQSLGQLEAAYPNAEGMVGSCALRMYMNPSLHDGTAQKISEDIGFQESILDNSRQKLVEAADLAGPQYKDFVIVMATGFKPFRLRKRFAYADQEIQKRMARV
jgi:type IV secretion system protein VirD4